MRTKKGGKNEAPDETLSANPQNDRAFTAESLYGSTCEDT